MNATGFRFYLGTHQACWLRRTEAPLFVSRRRLCVLKSLKRATCRWALDSGAFTEIKTFGRWQTTAAAYAEEALRYQTEIGKLDWAAIQDWMCEPDMLARTGLCVRGHQERTTASYLELKALAPGIRWAPVLQGWTIEDYFRHAENYHAAGVDLARCDVVGVGSVCRRQQDRAGARILIALSGLGLQLHGFGVKVKGLALSRGALASADSMAWSLHARKRPPLAGCSHPNCGSCMAYAMDWRSRVIAAAATPWRSYLDCCPGPRTRLALPD